MSGHSHYATIKRQKAIKDQAKGKIFSKMGRAISIAVKTGGGGDPDSNFKLRTAIDAARAASMPKENIERAISKGAGAGENIDEVSYEGFGPEGVGIIVEAATDNRNRTAQEIKNMFERGGGNLTGPGSVSFNFESKGLLVVAKTQNTEDQMLKLIDLGAEDVVETNEGVEVYVAPDELSRVGKTLQEQGFGLISMELVMKPKNLIAVNEAAKAQKILSLLDKLEEHDDVQKVFANIDIPDDVLQQITV